MLSPWPLSALHTSPRAPTTRFDRSGPGKKLFRASSIHRALRSVEMIMIHQAYYTVVRPAAYLPKLTCDVVHCFLYARIQGQLPVVAE